MTRHYINKKGNKTFTVTQKKFLTLLLGLLIFSSVFYSCSKLKVETSEAISDLIDNLKSENSDCTCEPYMNEYSWRNKTVYALLHKGPACSWFPTFYNSDGQSFILEAGYTLDRFLENSDFIRTVWTCEDINLP